jgi:hypothetical protein
MFQSFFLAGFEGSTGFNRHGEWFDQVVATGHDANVDEDYADIARLGLHAARETVRWPLVDCRGRYDFSSLAPFIEAAKRHDVGVIWDLFHYGFPQDVDLRSEAFVRRLQITAMRWRASWPRAWMVPASSRQSMSLRSWPMPAARGAVRAIWSGRGWELKVAARGAIAGINAIRAACPDARFVNVDPLCRVVCPDSLILAPQAHDFNNRLVFQSWTCCAAGSCPNSAAVLNIWTWWESPLLTNQWELNDTPNDDGNVPPLDDDDPRRAPLSDLILSVWKRYGRDVMITETSHVGDNRGPWLCEVVSACHALLLQNVPLRGACLYPILGMPEWHDRDLWTPMGLWDPLCHRDPGAGRLLCEPMAEALQGAAPLEALHQAKQEAEHRGEPRIDRVRSKAKRYATWR